MDILHNNHEMMMMMALSTMAVVGGEKPKLFGGQAPWSRVPAFLHQIWTGGIDEITNFEATLDPGDKRQHFLSWMQGCRNVTSHWERHRLWDLASMRSFVASEYPIFLDTYDNFDIDVKRTDFARILILFHFGGVYLDMDFECLRPMDDILRHGGLVLAEHESNYPGGEIPNAMMASTPRHPFFWLLLHEMQHRQRMNPGGYVTRMTGPHAFTETWRLFQAEFPSTMVKLYPPVTLYPVYCLDKVQMRRDAECIAANNCREVYPESLAVHHYAASWYAGQMQRLKIRSEIDRILAHVGSGDLAFDVGRYEDDTVRDSIVSGVCQRIRLVPETLQESCEDRLSRLILTRQRFNAEVPEQRECQSFHLFVVAHPDDETVFGFRQLLGGSGCHVVAIMTLSSAEREEELKRSSRLGSFYFLSFGYEDCMSCVPFTIERSRELASPEANLKWLLGQRAWDTVCTHNSFGEYGHPQHIEVNHIVTKSFAQHAELSQSQNLLVFQPFAIAEPGVPDVLFRQRSEVLDAYASQQVVLSKFKEGFDSKCVHVDAFNKAEGAAWARNFNKLHPFFNWIAHVVTD